MPRKVFVSYSHRQGEWVWDRLVPVLKAGGAEPLIDRERFRLGRALFDQMDALQDEADIHLLCLSEDYLASAACRHEMERAIALDPDRKGIVIPVKLAPVDLPDGLAAGNPLYADLRDDGDAGTWGLVLGACEADLGTTAPQWLEARDETRRFLTRGDSVSLVTRGDGIAWRALLASVPNGALAPLAVVDLSNPVAVSRRGLIEEILRALGIPTSVPSPPEDLVFFGKAVGGERPRRLALTHFDLVRERPDLNHDFFAALRYMVAEDRRLVLLLQSRNNLSQLLPNGHPISLIQVHQVELKGRR